MRLTEDDLVQLRLIHEGGRNTVMSGDVDRWRACGWLEPAPSWKLTPEGLALIGAWMKSTALPVLRERLRDCPECEDESDDLPPDDLLNSTLIAHGLPAVSDVVGARLADPGPDPSPPAPRPARPRTETEVRLARDALRAMSDALLAFSDPEVKAVARLAWIHSVLPLSTPEEVGDALAFVCRTLPRTREQRLYDTETIPKVMGARRAALDAAEALGALVDDMRAEADGGEDLVTDRRRSVTREPWMWEGPVGHRRIRVVVGDRALYVFDVEDPGEVDAVTHRAALAEALGKAVAELRAASSRS